MLSSDDVRGRCSVASVVAELHCLRRGARQIDARYEQALAAFADAIAQSIGIGVLAPADLSMARAAGALGFTAVTFGGPLHLLGSWYKAARSRRSARTR